ncbi:hypothetical protein [Paraburkholderia caffeinilytica]|uniref:hypothetical protein n=1 Tax=Paraburkholderia caffeinilytica TaxID=1761016 RepID=UPI0038BA38F1
MDSNHDIVPTLRMFDGLMMNKAADEIERLRALLNEKTTIPSAVALDDERVAFERHWYNFYHSGSIKARSDGRYMQPVVQHAWEAWQARAASPQPVEQTKQSENVLDWLETEVTAVSCRYHGDPSYDHDAYWMRDRVVKLIGDARKAFPAAQPVEQTRALAEDARDAARYRWLRQDRKLTPEAFWIAGGNLVNGLGRFIGAAADNAIDAAMTAAQPASGETE